MALDQTAIVTGAGRGIGRAIAEALAREGARVALVSRTAGQLEEVAAAIRQAGGIALPVPADVTDSGSVAEACARVEADLGPADLLVNNAGSFSGIGPVWDVDPERWWADVTTNVRGVFLPCRAVLPGMLERVSGRIINLIGGGTANPFPYGSGYASSKAAVMRFTECLAAELAEAGAPLAVFAVSPGLVRTALTEHQLVSDEGRRWMGRIDRMFAEGRDVPPTRAAELVAALASGRFDRLTGRWFGITDDLEALLERADDIVKRDEKTLRFR